MPMIFVAIFTLFLVSPNTPEQQNSILSQQVLAYSSLDSAAGALMAQMGDAAGLDRSQSLVVHGFRSGNQGDLNLDDLDDTFSNAIAAGPLELYKDPYLELMRGEMGLRPMQKLSAEAMLDYATVMDVSYVLSGNVTRLGSNSGLAGQFYQLELALTEVQSGEIIWRGHADVRLSQPAPQSW